MKRSRQNSYKDGYVSFSLAQIQQAIAAGGANAEAYRWLEKAMTTASKVQKKSKKGKVVDLDDVYPLTAEETMQMGICLDSAQKATVDASDGVLSSNIMELRSIVDWSNKRHWTFQWILIVGVIVTLFFISWMSGDSKKDVAAAEARVAQVEAWIEQDTTVVVENIKNGDAYTTIEFEGANVYKATKLEDLKRLYESSKEYEAEYLSKADTATLAKNKKYYLKSAKECKERNEKYLEDIEDIGAMKFKDVQKLALKDSERSLKFRKSDARVILFWSIFFMILIPLYIFAERPYGYNISRLRLESKIVGGIQKVLFGLAAGAFAGAAALEWAPDKIIHWSDGSRTREADTAGDMTVMVIKAMFYCLAIFVFCTTSCVIMTYLTVQGLRRNYDWKKIAAEAQSSAVAAKLKKEIEAKK